MIGMILNDGNYAHLSSRLSRGIDLKVWGIITFNRYWIRRG